MHKIAGNLSKECIHIAGHGTGSMIASDFAARCRERFVTA